MSIANKSCITKYLSRFAHHYLLFVALVSTSLYAKDTSKSKDDWSEPEGRYVMMDNYRLYFHCIGEGSPTVLFDGGIADSSANWLAIAEAISTDNRSCVFDRAGYGMSDAGPSPRTTSTIVSELQIVLRRANIPGPYILVGHSFGGYTMQYFASRFPETVSGMVLVESSHPEQVERLKELDQLPGADRKSLIKLPDENPQEMSEQQRFWSFMNANRKAIYAQMQELRSFKQSADEVLHERDRFPDVPLAVLTRGKAQLPVVAGKHTLEEVWQDMQFELSQLSSDSWQVVVQDSGHSIHLEAPHIVIENIQRVIEHSQVNTLTRLH